MSRGRWIAPGLVLVFTLGLLVAGCGGSTTTTTLTVSPVSSTTTVAPRPTTTVPATSTTATTVAETTTTVNSSPIKVGIALSLSGDSAAPCAQIKEGFETEAEYINSNGGINGREVQLVFQDDQSKIDTAMAAFQALIDQRCDVLIGPFPQWTTTPARVLSEKAGILHVAFGPPTLVELMEDQSKYKFSYEAAAGPDAEADAWVMALKTDGRKNVIAIGDQINIHQEGLTLMTQLAQQAGISFTKLADSWGLGETDLTPICNKIAAAVKTAKPEADALIIASNPVHVNIIIKTLKSLGVTQPVYGSGAGAHPLTMLATAGNDPANVAGDFCIGPAIVNPAAMPDTYAAKKDLVDYVARWQKEFPNEAFASLFLGFAYDTFHLAEQAIKNAGTDSEEDWAAAMAKIDWTGAQGHYMYSDTDHIGIHGGFVLWEYTNGQGFKFVEDLNSTK